MNSPETSQNLITIVVSAQPSSSKWWCSGVILNTRRPVSLNDPTWMITDIVTSTNRPPRIGSSNWVLVQTASPASTPPSPSDPESPMKILAGGAFHQRNPMQAPSTEAATTAVSSGSLTW